MNITGGDVRKALEDAGYKTGMTLGEIAEAFNGLLDRGINPDIIVEFYKADKCHKIYKLIVDEDVAKDDPSVFISLDGDEPARPVH